MINPLIEQFGKDKRWVTWKLMTRKGKTTKVPYSITGDMASSTDSDTWDDYETVKKFSDNVGIVFTPEQNLLGIDIDHVIDEKGNIPDDIKQFIEKADTYTEISPSKTGLHLFLKLETPITLSKNKKAPFEIYTSGRYFTVTEVPFGKMKPVREVVTPVALALLKEIGYPWSDQTTSDQKQPDLTQSKEEASTLNKKSVIITSLTDSQILDKMFSSKNGQKIRELYDRTDAKSEDDLALCSHLSFWCRKDETQMERIWMSSPMGSRKKTQTREDYRKRTISTAVKGCKEVYESPRLKMDAENKELDLDLLFVMDSKKDKIYTQNTENMCRILRKHPNYQGRLRFDSFRNVLEIRDQGKWRTIEDNDAVDIQTGIQILFACFGRVGKDMIYDAMIKVAKENAIDSALDYIKGLKWDNKNRLDTWLASAFGTPDDIYHKAVGANWIKGLVKRIVEPGCKFDYVLVLEGPQGSRKSTSLATLGRGWHVETTISTESKDFFMQFQGNVIIEFSEGETLSRTEVKRMKAIITTQTDKYRPSYGRAVLEFPRRCVFAMTTNDEEYLKDETGNRRWLPVRLGFDKANVEWIEENRDQIYAEAYHRITALKETIYEFPDKEVAAAQNERRVHYEYEDSIVSWYHSTKVTDQERLDGVTIIQAYRDGINGGFPSKMLTKADEMKIADVLKNTIGLIKKQEMISNNRVVRWKNPNITELDLGPALTPEEEAAQFLESGDKW